LTSTLELSENIKRVAEEVGEHLLHPHFITEKLRQAFAERAIEPDFAVLWRNGTARRGIPWHRP